MTDLLSHAAGGAPASLSELMIGMAEGNPNLLPLARYLAAQEQERTERPGDDEDELETALELAAAHEQAALEQRAVLERLWPEVEALRERNDVLAGALGACHLCWGDDEACAECDGHGAPGWVRPSPFVFAELVLPAVRRVARRHRRPAVRSASAPGGRPTTTEGDHRE